MTKKVFKSVFAVTVIHESIAVFLHWWTRTLKWLLRSENKMRKRERKPLLLWYIPVGENIINLPDSSLDIQAFAIIIYSFLRQSD